MVRIVLLGLGDEDVDVLSRLSRLDPSPEVLAVHPNPEALILRLASVASYPALTEPPRPRQDDIVVVPSSRGPMDAQMLRPWREVGARILLPDAPGIASLAQRIVASPAPAPEPETPVEPVVVAVGTGDGSSKPLETRKVSSVTPTDDMRSSGDGSLDAPPPEPPLPPARPEVTQATAPAPSGSEPPAPPPSVWEQPEETFRYLAAETVGPDRPVSLWWDGGADVWVPWVWTGPAPVRRPEPPESGLAVPSRWGSFRLGGAGEDQGRVPVAAFARVAEDLALRDIMVWRHEARQFVAHGLPEPDMSPAAIERWAQPLFAHLGVESALVWKREKDRYRLLHAAGQGVEFAGTLLMPATLVAATFESAGAGWRRWDPMPWLRVHLGAAGDDPRWPLRLRRMELALAGEELDW